MKKKLILGLVISCGLLLTACNKNETKPEQTFKYSISLDITNLRGPVILLDRTTNEPIKTIYPSTPEFKIEGELPMDKMHASFVLHFPTKYSNPYMYPVAEACAIDFYMDKNTEIKAHFDSLLFSNVKNEYIAKLKRFKSDNLPSVIAFETFNQMDLKRDKDDLKSESEQIAYANKGNDILAEVRKEVIVKTGQFANSEEMATVLAYWGGQVGAHELDSLAGLFDKSVQKTAAYKGILAVSEYLKGQETPPSLKIGDKAPEFSLKDDKENIHSLSDFTGKYLVIDFWASWCGPCKAEMPFMKKLYKRYHSKGLEMLAISIDKDPNAWKKAINKLNMPYLQLHDKNGNVANSYFVRGIPYVLLIDPKGNILAIERGEALEKLIRENLKI